MGLWDWLRGKKPDGKDAGGAATAADPIWLSAAESPFGVRTLDLRPVTEGMTSASTDPANAARAVSWGLAMADDIPPADLGADAKTCPCAFEYAIAPAFPDGLLFAPRVMEEKWALFHRGGSIIAVRSWTGQVVAVARGTRVGDRLTIEELTTVDVGFGPFGEATAMFDWLVRTHALAQVLPVPVPEPELDAIAQAPLVMFSIFGRMALYAASGFSPPEPIWPLRVFGALVQAVGRGDVAQVQKLLADGEDPNVPSPLQGFTALHLAMAQGKVEVMRALLAGGANPKLRSDRGADPIGLGIVQGAAPAVLEELIAAGGTLDVGNIDGFGLLHAAAEANRPAIVPWLAGRGLAIEARTARGLTPLHVACGNGHADAVRALIAAGADVRAASPFGTPREIATAGGHAAVADLLPAIST